MRNSFSILVSASSISEVVLSVGINPDERLINSVLPENELINIDPAGNYMFKIIVETLEQGVKYVQS